MSGTHTPLSFQSGGPDRYARLDKFGNLEVCNLSPGTTSGSAAISVNDLVIQGNTTNTAAAPGQYGIALGAGTTSGTTLSDNGTIAIGYLATALQQESIAIGQGATTYANAKNSLSIGPGAHCLNPSSPSDDDNQIAIGSVATCSGSFSVAVGPVTRCYAADAVAVGAGASTAYNITTTTITPGLTGQIAIGYQASTPLGTNNIAIGLNSFCNSTNAVCVGQTTRAYSTNSVCVGAGASTGYNINSGVITNGLVGGVAIGFQAQTPTGQMGIAIGINSIALCDNAIAIGQGNTVGTGAIGQANQGIAIGAGAVAGNGSNATLGSIAIGAGSIALFAGSVAIGPNQLNQTANSVVIGAQNAAGSPTYDFLRLQVPSNVTQTGSLTGTVTVAGTCGVITMFTFLGLANSYTFQVNCPYVGANSLVYLTVVRAGAAAINNTTSIPAGAVVGSINSPAQSFTVTVWNPNAGVTIPIGSTGNFAVAYWVTNTVPA